jgi:hypothetical protein
MCLFFIVYDKESKTVIKKAPEICTRFAYGQMCIEISNFNVNPSMQTISSENGTVIVTTPTGTSITLENVMKNYKADIKYSIVKPHIKEIANVSPRAIYNLYTELIESKSNIYRDATSSYKTPSTAYTIQTTKGVNKGAELKPCDSISMIGNRTHVSCETESVSDWLTEIDSPSNKSKYSSSPSKVSSRRLISHNSVKAIMMK